MTWGRLLDRQTALRLLAANASGKVKGGLDNFSPPSADLADMLTELDEDDEDGAGRQATVALFIAQTGGE